MWLDAVDNQLGNEGCGTGMQGGRERVAGGGDSNFPVSIGHNFLCQHRFIRGIDAHGIKFRAGFPTADSNERDEGSRILHGLVRYSTRSNDNHAHPVSHEVVNGLHLAFFAVASGGNQQF